MENPHQHAGSSIDHTYLAFGANTTISIPHQTLHTELGAMTNLEVLELDFCRELMILSEALVQLTILHKLLISDCLGPTKFVIHSWCSFASFTSLKDLELHTCGLTRISISPDCCPSLQTLYIFENHYLVEISSLPISVKIVEVMDCSNLASISLNPGLVKLKHLIAECYVENVIIKGLENCTLLETLALRTDGEVPVIKGLNDMESLRSVKLTADYHILALEPFLQSLNREKWPSKCAPAKPGAEEIVELFTFPSVTLVDSFDLNKIDLHDREDHADCGEP